MGMKIKIITFGSAFFLFLLVLYSVSTKSLFENGLVIVALLVFNIIAGMILPAVIKNSFTKELKEGLHLFGETVNKIVVSACLVFVYFFGIGLTWFAAKIFKKKFLTLEKTKEKSSWIKIERKEINFEKQF
jgi:amino acid transporter